MRVLVIGPGAEDARSPLWGHVVASLSRAGHEPWEYDPIAALRTDRTHDPIPALEWLLDEIGPELVIGYEPPAEVLETVAKRQLPTRLLTAEDFATTCHDELFAAGDEAGDAGGESSTPEYDVVVAGDATLPAVRALIALRSRGLRVHAWGDGWDSIRPLSGAVSGALPYPYLGAALRRGRLVLCVGPDGRRQALEAAAAGRAVLTGSTADELLAAAEAALAEGTPAPAPFPGASWTTVWTEALPAERVTARDRTPLVTFFMPTYNNVDYLASCLESVLDQPVDNIEILLQDDGSSDGTESVLRRFESNPRVRVLRQRNIGQRDRFDLLHRRTAHLARGEFLAALGSDDLCHPERLPAQLAVFEADPKVDFVFSAARRIDSFGRDRGKIFELLMSFSQHTLFRDLAVSNLLAHPTVLFRRNVYDRIGQMEEGFASDYHLWLKAAGRMRFRYLPRQLMSYRVHENSASTSSTGTPRAAVRGTEVHDLEVLRRGLGDLYPELQECETLTARAAAEVDLGNRLLWLFPGEAVHAYERAAAELGSAPPKLLHNLAVATLLAGDLPSAARLAKQSGLPEGKAVTMALASGQRTHDLLRSTFGAGHFSPTFHEAMRRAESRSILWDGMRADTRRVLVVPSPERPDLLGMLLRSWCQRTSPGDNLCLILPTLTRSPDELAADVLTEATRLGLDLDNSADVAIEGIDGLDLLPPQYLASAHMLESDGDLVDAIAAIGRGVVALPAPRLPIDGLIELTTPAV